MAWGGDQVIVTQNTPEFSSSGPYGIQLRRREATSLLRGVFLAPGNALSNKTPGFVAFKA